MYLTSLISKFLTPAGVLISTKSPLFFPINPFPIGDLKKINFFLNLLHLFQQFYNKFSHQYLDLLNKLSNQKLPYHH